MMAEHNLYCLSRSECVLLHVISSSPVFEERLAQCLQLDNIQNSRIIQGHMRRPHSLYLPD
jgi:hypothetical protein